MIELRWLAVALLLGACSSNVQDQEKETPLTGERISVLTFEQTLDADPQVGNVKISLPQPYRNLNWPQSGGSATKAMHHLEIGEAPKRLWRASIGRGSTFTSILDTPPIVMDGVLYAVDSEGAVSALNANTGGRIWRTALKNIGEKGDFGFGGGVAYGNGRLFVTSGYGFVVALDALSGAEIWRSSVTIPFRGAPSYADGRVFALTHDNQLFTFAAEDGAELWDHVGIVENSGIMGAASPAVEGDTVVAAYSSGELFALRVDNGRVAWTDTLARSGRLTAMADLADIDGDPVIDRGTVFAMSHSGRMAAIDFASGNRIWESNVGGVSTPWIAGDYIFAATADREVVAVMRRDGRVRWVTQLQRYTDSKDREGIIKWSGPILASDRLIVLSSHGYILSLSPYDGTVLSGIKTGDKMFIAPVIANGTLYVLTDDGYVVAYR